MELDVFYVVHKSFSFSLSWGRLIESMLSHYIYLTYRASTKSFPDYKHLLQENYVEYKLFFFEM
jgi:hypothetical protein